MRITAGVLLRDYEGRVLLDVPSAEPVDGETPLEAAERGLAEAIGVHRRPGRLLLVDVLPEELVFVFDGGRLDDLEGIDARFVDVSELDGLVSPEVSARIATIVSETGDVYAEGGRNLPGAGWGVPLAEEA